MEKSIVLGEKNKLFFSQKSLDKLLAGWYNENSRPHNRGRAAKKGSQQLEAFSRKDIKNELKQDGNPSLLS